jgi:hypothetical protein
VPTAVQSAYGELLSSFVNALWSQVDPHEMTIEPDAVEMLLDFQDKIEPRLAKDSRARSSDQRPDSQRYITSAGTDQPVSCSRSPSAASPVASSWHGTPSSTTAM